MPDDEVAKAVAASGRRGAPRGSDAVYTSAVFDAETSAFRVESDDTVDGHRSTRARSLVLAGAALAVVIVAGVVWVGRSDDAEPVLSGPAPEQPTSTWIGPALLAPTGVDWQVNAWTPGDGTGEGSRSISSYLEGFTHEGVGWSLNVFGPDPELFHGDVYCPGQQTRQIGTRAVRLDLDETSASERVQTLSWSEQDGSYVMLTPVGVGPGAGPPLDTVISLVESIADVPLADWTSALMPPEGVPDPVTGATARPLRLGLPAGEAETSLNVQPWTTAKSEIRLSSGIELELDSWTKPLDGLSAQVQPDGTPATVRGAGGSIVRAQNSESSSSPAGDGDGEVETSALVWDEGGARMSFGYPSSLSDDDAVALADSLVVLDDSEWRALLLPPHLFSDATEDPAQSSGTTSTVPASGEIVLGATRLTPLDSIPEGVVPLQTALNATDPNGNPVPFNSPDGRAPKTFLARFTDDVMTDHDASGNTIQAFKDRTVWVVYYDGVTESQIWTSKPLGPESNGGEQSTSTVSEPSSDSIARGYVQVHLVDAYSGHSLVIFTQAEPSGGLPGS